MKKRIMSLLVVLCLVIGVLPVKAGAVTADSFTDVSKDSWYYDYVDYVAKKGYFAGTTRTTFSPDRSMTRAMFVVVLARHDGVTVDNSKGSFSDVAAGAWYAGAVKWASENSIVLGYPDGTFKPNESITRAQMCSIMDNYVNYYTAKHKATVEKKGTSVVLADQNEIPAYAKTAVKNCQTYGLIQGYGDGTFRPQATSTRAHVAAVIYRLSFLAESAKPSSGGGVGPTTTTDTYTVRVQFSDFPVGSLNPRHTLELTADYKVTTAANGNTSGDTTVNALATELVTGDNKTALQYAIQTMLNNVKGRNSTATVSGQTVTVNVSNDENPVISATTTVPVDTIVNGGGSPFAAVSEQDIVDLVRKLEAGGSQTLTATDLDALDTVIGKLNDLQAMNNEEIREYLQNGNEVMQQAAAGLRPDDIRGAIEIYNPQLQQIKIDAILSGGAVDIGSPVTMTVTVNLPGYLDRANTLHQNNEDRAIQRLAEKLGVTDRLSDPEVSRAVRAIYELSRPGDFVTTSGNNLVLKSKIDYYNRLVAYVNAMCALREAVRETSTFYAAQLGRAQDRVDGHSSLLGGTELTSSVLADLLGTTEEEEITNTVTGEILNVNVHVNDTSYSEMHALLPSNLQSQIPGSVPSGLDQFLGTYNLKVLIEA